MVNCVNSAQRLNEVRTEKGLGCRLKYTGKMGNEKAYEALSFEEFGVKKAEH